MHIDEISDNNRLVRADDENGSAGNTGSRSGSSYHHLSLLTPTMFTSLELVILKYCSVNTCPVMCQCIVLSSF